jgi:hypothetical protein
VFRHPHLVAGWLPIRSRESEAERLIRGHMIPEERVIPYRALAASRGVPLADVIRAAFRGDLLSIVTMPTVGHTPLSDKIAPVGLPNGGDSR